MILALWLGCSSPPAPLAPGWHVYALEYGRSDHFARSSLVLGAPADQSVPASWMVWVARDPTHVVLVDTGFRDEALAQQWGIHDRRTAAAALSDLGLTAADVTDVVITHAHWDHLGGLADFPAAEVWMQRAEVDWARRSVSREHPESKGVRLADVEVLDHAHLHLVDGDADLARGIRLHRSGGHTPGCQWVEVQAEAPIVLAGDIAYLLENVETGVPPGGSMDPEADRAAIAAMQKLAPGRVLPGHDPLVLDRFPHVAERAIEVR